MSFHKIRLIVLFTVVINFIGLAFLVAQSVGKVPIRNEINEQFKWDLTALFESDAAWEKSFLETEKLLADFPKYEDKLGKSADQLLQCLELSEKAGMLMDRLFSYAGRKRDQDLNITTYEAMIQKIQGLGTKMSSATAFMEPEILAISDKKMKRFIKKEPSLSLYEHYFANLRRVKDHILSKEMEELMSLTGPVAAGSGTAFGILTNSDFDWGNILDEQNSEVEMSRSRYYLYMSSPDRRVRHDAYKELYVPYSDHLNTLTSLYATRVKTDVFYMKARKYNSSLEAALSGPNIPVEVYHNLINTINDNLEPLHRWASLKKRILEVEELHPYDTYAPLFPDIENQYTYEEAQAMIMEAFKPLGPEVLNIVDRALKERWIDVYENVGKRGGAYSSGIFGVHPYILMNFNGTLNSVFTLAHELGHTIHSYLANKTQPYIYADYAIFNAEVASTTNEALLMDYLLKTVDSDNARLSLLQQYVEDIGSTFYRQARFAEFELVMHEKVENDEPLTYEVVNQIFSDIYQKYWGPDMVVDEEEKLSWSRIPHFYYNFYVYSYATSFAASQMVAHNINTEGQSAVDAYLKFLSSGGSDYPIELLKIAGVDMSTPAPIEATTAKMNELLKQMEIILSRTKTKL